MNANEEHDLSVYLEPSVELDQADQTSPQEPQVIICVSNCGRPPS